MERVIKYNWLKILVLPALIITISNCKVKKKDSDIQTSFNSKALTDPNLAGVSATVMDGTITLTGSCVDEKCRTSAERSVKEIKGVVKIINNIQVVKVRVAEDGPLLSLTNEVVHKYEGVQADVKSGVITVRGTIDNRNKLEKLMLELQALRPKNVQNQIVIINK